MTNIITRYYESAAQARSVVFELVYRQRLSPRIIDLYEKADGLTDKLAAYKVLPETAEAYQDKLATGGAVILVRAGIRPLAVAKTTREVTAAMGAADMGGLTEEVLVKDERPPSLGLSVLRDHRHMMTRPLGFAKTNYHMADWPIGLISRRKPFTGTVIPPHGRMATWPIDLLLPATTRYGRFPFDFLVPGHKYMAKFPFAHLIPGHKFQAKFPFGHLVPHNVRYGRFPFGLLVPGHKYMAKFPFAHLVPGHQRMASWPFPLLINGKQGRNALIPGHKYQAKFPIDHLVPGHKYMANFPIGHRVSHNRRYGRFPFGLLVPGQKFMAKFPFAHIVPGHKHMAKFPFGHIVPGHKYMANFIFPHTKTSGG